MPDLTILRQKIDELDRTLIETLRMRMGVVGEVDAYKKANNLPAFDSNRWQEMVIRRIEWARQAGLDETLTREIFDSIHRWSLRLQGYEKAEEGNAGEFNQPLIQK
jgi:chorismate mutase